MDQCSSKQLTDGEEADVAGALSEFTVGAGDSAVQLY
jgi:hypothetical protein